MGGDASEEDPENRLKEHTRTHVLLQSERSQRDRVIRCGESRGVSEGSGEECSRKEREAKKVE